MLPVGATVELDVRRTVKNEVDSLAPVAGPVMESVVFCGAGPRVKGFDVLG
jgi:hypothetical protein